MRLSAHDFERLVIEALQLIPPEIRRYMENVQIGIEDAPPDKLLDAMGIPEDETLYGLYEGMPLTERDTDYSAFPDRVTIYREPLLTAFDDPAELRHEVARTVIHEIAHHFGIDDAHLTELGWD